MKKVVTLNMYDICNKIYFFYTHRVPLTGLKNPPKFASRPTCGFLALLIVATNQVLFLNSSSLASIISSHEKLLCDLRSNRARRKKREEHEIIYSLLYRCLLKEYLLRYMTAIQRKSFFHSLIRDLNSFSRFLFMLADETMIIYEVKNSSNTFDLNLKLESKKESYRRNRKSLSMSAENLPKLRAYPRNIQ